MKIEYTYECDQDGKDIWQGIIKDLVWGNHKIIYMNCYGEWSYTPDEASLNYEAHKNDDGSITLKQPRDKLGKIKETTCT